MEQREDNNLRCLGDGSFGVHVGFVCMHVYVCVHVGNCSNGGGMILFYSYLQYPCLSLNLVDADFQLGC